MMGRRFLGIQTVISGETRFLRTVYGAMLGLMRLNFLSVVSAFASPFNTSAGPLKAVIQAVMGGIASRLSGGRFENGAITAAFSYLFNELGHAGGKGYDASTSAPTDKLNLFSPLSETGMWLSAVRDKGIDGFFNVYAHGSQNGLFDGTRMYDETETRALLVDKGWKGQPVALFSCNCGGAGYAQRLANVLGVEVMAPDGFYYYNKDGSGRAGTYINGTWPANGVRGVDPQIGSMRPFLPTRR